MTVERYISVNVSYVDAITYDGTNAKELIEFVGKDARLTEAPPFLILEDLKRGSFGTSKPMVVDPGLVFFRLEDKNRSLMIRSTDEFKLLYKPLDSQ